MQCPFFGESALILGDHSGCTFRNVCEQADQERLRGRAEHAEGAQDRLQRWAKAAEYARDRYAASVQRQQAHIETIQADLKDTKARVSQLLCARDVRAYQAMRTERDEAQTELAVLKMVLADLAGTSE